jgi:hypothetical protein
MCKKNKINDGDNSIAKKGLYFGASLRGTTQYWSQRGKELRALIQYQINEIAYTNMLIHQKLET